MFKLLFGIPLLLGACLLGGVLLLPLFAIGAAIFALVVSFGVVALVLRIVAGVMIGAGGIVFAVLGLVLLAAGASLVLALGAALVQLLFPVLLVVGLIWIIRRSAKPQPPLQLTHSRI